MTYSELSWMIWKRIIQAIIIGGIVVYWFYRLPEWL